LWPLIVTEISSDQLETAFHHVKELIGSTQQPQPNPVEDKLQLALDAWTGGDNNLSEQHLLEAGQIARQYGYI
jgi:hypothetical protein